MQTTSGIKTTGAVATVADDAGTVVIGEADVVVSSTAIGVVVSLVVLSVSSDEDTSVDVEQPERAIRAKPAIVMRTLLL